MGRRSLNVYTAWPESLSQPIFKAYTAKTGVPINFIRLSTGELVARATAEKNNPRAEVIWGAPGDGFAAVRGRTFLGEKVEYAVEVGGALLQTVSWDPLRHGLFDLGARVQVCCDPASLRPLV